MKVSTIQKNRVPYVAMLTQRFAVIANDDNQCSIADFVEGVKLAAITFDKDIKKLSCCAV